MAIDLFELLGVALVEVATGDLDDEGLRALADLAAKDAYEGCSLIACHRAAEGGTETVIVEIYVELGQAERVNDVREKEPVAIVASPSREVPSVYPLRPDFPQLLPHMNLNYRGQRRSLCLFDASPEDIVHIYNPALLVERVRWWMQKSAYGQLHGVDQPLDPAIAPAFQNLILPPDFDPTADSVYAAVRKTKHFLSPIVLIPWNTEITPDDPQYTCTHIVTPPVGHGSMIDLPENMAELIKIYSKLGVDLAEEIAKFLAKDLNDQKLNSRVRQDLLLLVTTPLVGSDGAVRGKTSRAFLSPNVSLLGVAKALGVASDFNGNIGRLLGGRRPDQEVLRNQKVIPLNVVDGFTPFLARASSGLPDVPPRILAAIGVGALGSQTVLNLARMGQSTWQLIDYDFLAPHNLARHATSGDAIGCSKVELIAEEINKLFQVPNAKAHHELVYGDKTPEAIFEVLAGAERILDFSASVKVGRWLANSNRFENPISSYFVTPSGNALVAFHEGQKRQDKSSVTEMAYYSYLIADPELHMHLSTAGKMRIGSCREVSVTIPQSRMALFAALSAADVEATRGLVEARVSIWSLNEDGGLSVRHRDIPKFHTVKLVDWTLKISMSVSSTIAEARACGEIETGGILLGGYDLGQRTVFVTAALRSPRDSKASRTYFDRGARGVKETIEAAERITMSHITYVGEWHTHPTGCNSALSDLDRELLRWVADLRQLFLMPGILLVQGDDGLRAVVQKQDWSAESLC